MAAYRFLTEAKAELEFARETYDRIDPYLGLDFIDEARRLCRLIGSFPLAGMVVRPGIRRRIMRRFPFSVLYTIEDDDTATIIAIAHQGRKPEYWSNRVQESAAVFAA